MVDIVVRIVVVFCVLVVWVCVSEIYREIGNGMEEVLGGERHVSRARYNWKSFLLAVAVVVVLLGVIFMYRDVKDVCPVTNADGSVTEYLCLKTGALGAGF